jgi:membrane fusion protein (multidrug efflux system)
MTRHERETEAGGKGPRTGRRSRILVPIAALGIVTIAALGIALSSRSGASRDGGGLGEDGSPAQDTGRVASAAPTTGSESMPDAAETRTEARRMAPLPVGAVVAERAPFVLTVRATGRAEARRRADLSPSVGERITAVHVTEGDRVRAGEPLVELERRPFEIALQEAGARVANAESDYHLRLLSDPTPTDDRRELVAHRTGLTEARALLARAELDLEGTVLRAPFDGEVARVLAEAGERVAANTPLVGLVDLDPIRIPAEVLETDFGRLETGAAARVRFPARPGELFEGTVAALGPEIDPERGTGVAYVRLANRDGRIKPGMYAEVEIAGRTHPDRIALPRGAVLERDRRLLVFRVSRGRAEWQYVETGLETAESVEITTGVAAGDTVLVDGHLTLAHGAPVDVTVRR